MCPSRSNFLTGGSRPSPTGGVGAGAFDGPQSLLLEEKVARLLAVTDVVVSLCDYFIVTAVNAAYTSSVKNRRFLTVICRGALATGKRLILIRCAAHHPQGEAFGATHRHGHSGKGRTGRLPRRPCRLAMTPLWVVKNKIPNSSTFST